MLGFGNSHDLTHRESFPEQPGPLAALVHEARQIDENQAIGRGLDLGIGRYGFTLGQDLLAVGQDEILEQQRRMRMWSVPEQADAGREGDGWRQIDDLDRCTLILELLHPIAVGSERERYLAGWHQVCE